MKKNDIIDYLLISDIRVYNAIENQKKTDTAFTNVGIFRRYSPSEVRQVYFKAMALGMSEGINIGSQAGQRIDLYNNVKTDKEKEFLDKLYELFEKYKCGINYNTIEGMTVISLDYETRIH